MKKILLIGDPVSHSLSPKMHNAAFKALGIALQYESFGMHREKFEDNIGTILENENIYGANITAPFKTKISPFIETSEVAVNTIKRNKRGFVGYNTDVYGIKKLLSDIGYTKHFRALILGAGGGAISSLAAINALNGKARVISRRDFEWKYIESLALRARLVINATGSDDFKFDWANIPPEVDAVDLRYSPLELRFLENAKNSNHKTFDGLKILLHQGAKSFEIWTGLKAPLDLMSRAIGL